MMAIQITLSQQGNCAIATVIGEIDGSSAPELQAQALPALSQDGSLILDLKGVTYMSSAGLRTLLLLYRQATARNARVALVGLSEMLKDTMEITGFLKFFVVAEHIEGALKGMQA